MKRPIIGVIIVVGLLTLWSSLYTINETEQVIITQFGELVGQAHTDPGLHMKVPFIQQVITLDKRWLEWSGDPTQIVTKDKKFLWVDTYTRWRVKDPILFYQRVRDERAAQSRLDDIVDGDTRNVIASNDLIEVVRTTDRKFAEVEETADMGTAEASRPITTGRTKITQSILDKSRPIVAEFGIELVDVQIRRVNYVQDVQQKVFDRMISERRRVAERSRSEGQGKADGESTRIYAEAYSRDPELYQFLKTMETYRKTFAPDTTLILSTEGEFFKYLKQSK